MASAIFGGSVEIINTTIAKNGAARGGGVYNDLGGFVSIINSTITRECGNNAVR